MQKNHKGLIAILQLAVIVIFVVGIYLFLHKEDSSQDSVQLQSSSSTSTNSSVSPTTTSALPDVSSSDWELVLVNRDNITEEMNPDLTDISGILVDSRISENVLNFLAAAQAIDSNEHLISGYRSVAYQEDLYKSYVNQEMANDPTLTQEAAEELVQTYSQPAGASEHQTGLAIDLFEACSKAEFLSKADLSNYFDWLNKNAYKY